MPTLCSSAPWIANVVGGSLLNGLHARTNLLALASLLALSSASVAFAQRRSDRESLAVEALWREYLSAKKGAYAANAGARSPLWSAEEQSRWPMYDLAGFYLPDNAVPEIVSIKRSAANVKGSYQVVTQFWSDSTAMRRGTSLPILTMTVYARREKGRWAFASALSYTTANWKRQTRGRIDYRIAPTLRFSPEKAERAAKFVDSLATALDVEAPARIEYYVCESVDQAMQIIGAVVPERFGAAGGFSKPINHQVFSGIPALGEEYRHELAHVVLMPIVQQSGSSLLASEGVPSWLGGTGGRDYRRSVSLLDSLLQGQQEITLDRIVDDHALPSTVRNAAGAVLSEMVHEKGGRAALRTFLQAPDRRVRDVLMQTLDEQWPRIVAEWRARVRRIAGT